jgi:hypothetical protein
MEILPRRGALATGAGRSPGRRVDRKCGDVRQGVDYFFAGIAQTSRSALLPAASRMTRCPVPF